MKPIKVVRQLMALLISGFLLTGGSSQHLLAWVPDQIETNRNRERGTSPDEMEKGSSSLSAQDIRKGNIEITIKKVLTKEDINLDNAKIEIGKSGNNVTVKLTGSPVSPQAQNSLKAKITSSLTANSLRNVNLTVVSPKQASPADVAQGKTSISQGQRLKSSIQGETSKTPSEKSSISEKAKGPNPSSGISSPKDQAKAIIVKHLEAIKGEGKMSSAITTVDHWKDVFAKAGKAELFDAAKPDLTRALNAGLKPYNDGGSLSAKEFATLALKELGPTVTAKPVQPTGTTATPAKQGATSGVPVVTMSKADLNKVVNALEAKGIRVSVVDDGMDLKTSGKDIQVKAYQNPYDSNIVHLYLGNNAPAKDSPIATEGKAFNLAPTLSALGVKAATPEVAKSGANLEPKPTSKLPPEMQEAALKFAKQDLGSFSKAVFNREGIQNASKNLVEAAPVFNSPSFTKAAQQLTTLCQNPWENREAIVKSADSLNSTLHDNGLHVNISVQGPDDAAPEGRALIMTYEISAKKTVDVKGQSIPVFEIKKADGLNTDIAAHGHQEKGNSYAFTNAGTLDERAGEIGQFQKGQRDLALTMPTNSGPQPMMGLPKEASNTPAKLDGIIRDSMGNMGAADVRQGLGDSTAKHEAFHVYFFKSGGEANVEKNVSPQMVGQIHEQGAYLHQLATTSPELTKVVLADMFNKAFGSSGGDTTAGTTAALFGLQQQLPGVKFFKQTESGKYTNAVDYSQLPKLFSMRADQIQAAASAARDEFLNQYLPQPR